jgi:pterin-4a-carbinolamine dehydratase
MYSVKQLEIILNSINEALKEDLNKFERWCFLNNKVLIKDRLKVMYEDLPEDDQDYLEYRKKLFNIWIENGAEYQNKNGKVSITSFDSFDVEKGNKKIEKLNKEYKEAIQRQKEITKKKNEILHEPIIEIDWYQIDFDKVKDNTNEKILNENTIQLVK